MKAIDNTEPQQGSGEAGTYSRFKAQTGRGDL